jgi:hypothetical protein
VFNEYIKNEINEIGIFPALLDGKIPEIYEPRDHLWTSEAIVPMELFVNDGLPKYSHGRTTVNKPTSKL